MQMTTITTTFSHFPVLQTRHQPSWYEEELRPSDIHHCGQDYCWDVYIYEENSRFSFIFQFLFFLFSLFSLESASHMCASRWWFKLISLFLFTTEDNGNAPIPLREQKHTEQPISIHMPSWPSLVIFMPQAPCVVCPCCHARILPFPVILLIRLNFVDHHCITTTTSSTYTAQK